MSKFALNTTLPRYLREQQDRVERFAKDDRVVVSEIRDKDAIVGSIKDFLGKGK